MTAFLILTAGKKCRNESCISGNSQSCGYGLLLDGSRRADGIIERAVNYDVMCGVARRAWGRNENSIETVREHKRQNEIITLPYLCSDTLIDEIIK